MNPTFTLIALSLLLCSTTRSQEITRGSVAEPESKSTSTPPQTTEVIATPDSATATERRADDTLPEGERRLRAGIVILGNLHNILAGIQDNDTAEKAVAPLMRICNELNLWAQSFTALPPMNETEQAVCEDKYLPIIKKINYSIKSQGERLAAAEYYGSMNLPAVLVKLAILNQ